MDAGAAPSSRTRRRDGAGSEAPVPVAVDRLPGDVLVACRAVVEGLQDQPRVSVAVTSAARGEGRTLVALGLARVLRREQGRTVVVLAFPPQEQSGASEPAGAPEPADQVLTRLTWPEDRLGVLPVDVEPAAGSTLPALLTALHGAGYDVVADLPPLGTAAVEESLSLFSLPVLVIPAGSTPVDEARRALSRMPTDTVVVLNRTTTAVPRILTRWLGG